MRFEEIAEALNQNEFDTLDKLYPLNKEELEMLIKILKENTTLKILRLNQHQLDDECICTLINALQNNHAVTELDLSSNNISNKGAQSIADWLKKNPSLIALNLSQNKIGNAGARDLMEALKANKTLKKFNIYCNPISASIMKPLQNEICIRHEALLQQQSFFRSSMLSGSTPRAILDNQSELPLHKSCGQ